MPNDGSVVIGTELDESGFRSGVKGLTGLAKAGGLAVGAAIGAAIGATAAFGKAAVDAGTQFDASMSQVAATMGTTVDQIGHLRQYAIDMGASTAFSASQSADALNYMALAGYTAEESMQALPNVLNLAAAGNIALASASDMVTDAQSALGLSFDETAVLVDKMAKASSKSNTSVAQLGDAILTVGGTAKNLAGGTTELATVLGLLADNGIKGAEGGTALRNIILSLSAPTDKAAKRMKELGLEVFDAEGKMRPMEDIMLDLNGVLSDMTQGEQTQVLNEIFNKVDLKSVNALLATNVKRWGELSGAIDDAQGAAAAMAETQLDNLAGDVTLFKSALEGAQITVSDSLTPTLRKFVQFGTSEIGKLDKAFQSGGIKGFAKQLGTSLGDAIGMIGDYIPAFVDVAVTAAGAVFSSIFAKLQKEFPNILRLAQTALSKLGNSIATALPSILSGIGDMIGQLIANTPRLIALGLEIIAKIAVGILQGIPDFLKNIAKGFAGMFEAPIAEEVLAAQQQLDKLREKINSVTSEIETSLSGGLSSVDADFGMARKLLDIFDELSTKTYLTRDEQEKLNLAVDGLNEIIPDLGLKIDEETGKWNLNTQEIYTNIAAMEARARAEIYLDHAKKILAEIVELEQERDKSQEIYNALEARQNVLNAAYLGSKSILSELSDAYKDVAKNGKSVSEIDFSSNVKAWAEANGYALNTASDLQKAATEASKAVTNQENAAAESSKELEIYAKQVKEAEDALRILEGRADKLFDKAAAYESAAREASQGQANAYVDELTKAEPAARAAAREILNATLEGTNNPEGFAKNGEQSGEGYVRGIRSKVAEARAAARDMVNATLSAMQRTAEIKSPSRLFKREVGEYIGEGVIDGVDQSLAGLYDVLDARISGAVDAEQQSVSAMEGVSGAITGAINANRAPEYVETTIEIDGRKTAKVLSPYVTKEVAWREE